MIGRLEPSLVHAELNYITISSFSPTFPQYCREDCGADELIDLIEGNRKYVRCLYVFNKIDAVSMEDVDRLAREPHSIVMSATMRLNLDKLVDTMWIYLGLTR